MTAKEIIAFAEFIRSLHPKDNLISEAEGKWCIEVNEQDMLATSEELLYLFHAYNIANMAMQQSVEIALSYAKTFNEKERFKIEQLTKIAYYEAWEMLFEADSNNN